MSVFGPVRLMLWKRKDEHAQNLALTKWRWPRDRKLILYAARKGKIDYVRQNAIRLIGYPDERDLLISIATDRDCRDRHAALKLLQYPDDREILIRTAREDSWEEMVRTAVEKLPYPREREALITIAKKSVYPKYAVMKLDAEADRTVLEDLPLHGQQFAAFTAIHMLRDDESREAIERCALEAGTDFIRKEAIDRLRYPASRETLVKILRSGAAAGERVRVMRKLPYPGEAELIDPIIHPPEGGEPEHDAVYEAALIRVARAGICPMCGGEIVRHSWTEYMNDDPNDVSREMDSFTCRECGWKKEE